MATAADMMRLIRARHSGQEWSVIEAVPDGTGMIKGRTADALAMSLWPSKGLDLYGFEIKVSRSDWLREIQDPLKADAFARYCDFWFIVAPDGIVKLEEMPGSWGLMVPTKAGDKLKIAKGAERQKDVATIDRAFLAGLMRTLHKQMPGENELKAAYKKGVEEGSEIAEKERDRLMERGNRELKDLRRAVQEFEAASGVEFGNWKGEMFGKAFKAMVDADLPGLLWKLEACHRNQSELEEAIQHLRSAIGEKEEAAA